MSPQPPAVDYLRCQRHILLDMHVPDELYARAGADSVMVHCNSMVGLTYWPAEVGKMHPGLGGRDVVGETVEALHARGIAACAYYNIWAHDEHPEWRIELAGPSAVFDEDSRFGVCCPASGEFRDFAGAQAEEIVRAYEFDAFFCDMMAWTGVCVCGNCRDRYRQDVGAELPEVIDWWAAEWCTFQATRERWVHDQFTAVVAAVKTQRAIPVFHNNGLVTSTWLQAWGTELAESSDLLGSDVPTEPGLLQAFGHVASRPSPSVFQYMHSGSALNSGAIQLKSVEEQLRSALIATAFNGQFMAIDAVLPDGRVYAPTYDRLAEVFAAMRPYGRFLGGNPVADIAVYFSPSATVDFVDNGSRISELKLDTFEDYLSRPPHTKAVYGACATLQRAHLPVGVVTRADLNDLDAFAVVVLPNVLRLDEEEIATFRGYVERDGRLYASGYTSLVGTAGIKYDDFALSDLFGCHVEDAELAVVSYLRPTREDTQVAIAPTAVVPHGTTTSFGPPAESGLTTLLVNADQDARTIVTLTRPYGLGQGNRTDRAWASPAQPSARRPGPACPPRVPPADCAEGWHVHRSEPATRWRGAGVRHRRRRPTARRDPGPGTLRHARCRVLRRSRG